MSMPIIQKPENPIDREQAVSDLIESVALMETGLSHVINAEGEKIQKVVDPDADYPLEDIVAVNNSAEKMINTISKLEMMLQSKLESTKDFDTGTTPSPSPTPIEGSGAIIQYNNVFEIGTNAIGAPNSSAVLSFAFSPAEAYIINLNGNPEEFANAEDFSVFPLPRDGILTSVSAFFTMDSLVAADVQIVARVYKADANSSTYYPLEGAIINLAPVIPASTVNAKAIGIVENLNIPLEANSKIGLIIYCTSSRNVTFTGTAGAAINIQ